MPTTRLLLLLFVVLEVIYFQKKKLTDNPFNFGQNDYIMLFPSPRTIEHIGATPNTHYIESKVQN